MNNTYCSPYAIPNESLVSCRVSSGCVLCKYTKSLQAGQRLQAVDGKLHSHLGSMALVTR